MKRILILLFAALCHSSFAQVPGYIGKKMIIGLDYFTFPSASNYNKNFEKGLTKFRSIKGVCVDYTVSRSVSLGFRASTGSAGVLTYNAIKHTSNDPYYDFTYYDKFYVYYKYRTTDVAFLVKFFTYTRKGNLAPVGAYREFSFHLVRDKLTHLAGFEHSEKKSLLYPMAGFTIGYRNIILNRIVVDFGARLALPLDPRIIDSPVRSVRTLARAEEGAELSHIILGRGMSIHSVNLKLGIGLLLF